MGVNDGAAATDLPPSSQPSEAAPAPQPAEGYALLNATLPAQKPDEAPQAARPQSQSECLQPIPSAPGRPDAGCIPAEALQLRALPLVTGTREGRFQAVVKRSALNDVHTHGQSTTDVEICGVLVGNVYRDARGPYLYVEAAIRGEHAGSANAQVTFTAETWNHIQKVMEEKHPQQRILGWYHTHPGFGVFLSGMDLFIQENFFNEAWQVALVYDPRNREEGLFVWKGGNPDQDRFLIEEDADDENPNITMCLPGRKSTGGDNMASLQTFEDISNRLRVLEERQKWFPLWLALLAVAAMTWPLVVIRILPHRFEDSSQQPRSTSQPANGDSST